MTAVYQATQVDVVAENDVTDVVQNTLNSIGFTFDQLADQAQTRHFDSIEARLAWLAIGDLYRG